MMRLDRDNVLSCYDIFVAVTFSFHFDHRAGVCLRAMIAGVLHGQLAIAGILTRQLILHLIAAVVRHRKLENGFRQRSEIY